MSTLTTLGVALGLIILSLSGGAQAPGAIYDIVDFGAKSDGTTYNTTAIQKAIDRAAQAGGGTVRIPAGRFLTRRIKLRSGVTLHLAKGARLLGPATPEDYQGLHHLIFAIDAKDIAITGPGQIDGRAGDDPANGFWDVGGRRGMTYPKKDATQKAALIFIFFRNCQNVRLEDVRLSWSPGWTVLLDRCRGVRVKNVEILNSVYGPNTDGFDVVGSRDVSILDCRITTADDAIVLKTSRADSVCGEVTVRRCELISPSYGFKIGTESSGSFRNIRCEEVTIRAPDARGIRGAVALLCVDGGTLSDVVISGVKAKGVRAALFMRLGNRGRGQAEPKAGTFSNVLVENFSASAPHARDWSSGIAGLPGHPIRNVELRDIEIEVQGGKSETNAEAKIEERPAAYPDAQMFGDLPSYGVFVRHAEDIRMNRVRVTCAKPDKRPALFCDDVVSLSLAPFLTEPKVRSASARLVIFQAQKEKPTILAAEKNGVWTLRTQTSEGK